MLTGDIRNQIDRIWDAFWSGGISNPLEVMEQITYLLFLRRLDDLQTLEENKSARLGRPIERRVFPEGSDPRGKPYAQLRGSRFRAKARQFLRQHENHLTIHKLRWNMPLTPTDLGELERVLVEAGVGTSEDLSRAKQEGSGLGLCMRSLIGLDREAAKQAFGHFLAGKVPSANQIEFINLIIDHLTEHGVMDPSRLYESPFTDINPQGPEGVFTSVQVGDLVVLLREIRERAAA